MATCAFVYQLGADKKSANKNTQLEMANKWLRYSILREVVFV